MHPFREAVERRDPAAIEALLAEGVVFTSPVAFKPYPGKAITAAILRAVMQVFEDFRYVREFASEDGRGHALAFTATVDGKRVDGCDFLHLDEDGLSGRAGGRGGGGGGGGPPPPPPRPSGGPSGVSPRSARSRRGRSLRCP